MTDAYDEFVAHATKELTLIGFDKIELGQAMEQYLAVVYKTVNGDKIQMLNITNMLTRIINKKPLSPITEDDFELRPAFNPVEGGFEEFKDLRCTRCLSVHKEGDSYYDDEAITFINKNGDRMFVYQGDTCSRQKVELPYYPQEITIKYDQ
jgi:hypothetical protein